MIGRRIWAVKNMVGEIYMRETEPKIKDLRAPRRQVFWTSVDLRQFKDLPSEVRQDFEKVSLSLRPESDDDWVFTFRETRGQNEPIDCRRIFEDEEEARNHFAHFRNGREVIDEVLIRKPLPTALEHIRHSINTGAVNRSDYFKVLIPNELPNLVLEKAGIVDENGVTDEGVMQELGQDRIRDLVQRFPNTWECAAQMEYVMRMYSQDSPAFVAAAYKYNRLITEDLFLAGYLIRDLEVLCRDFDALADSKFVGDQKRKIGKQVRANRDLKKRYQTLIARMALMMKDPVRFEVKRDELDLLSLAKSAAEHLQDKAKSACWSGGGKGSVEQYLKDIMHYPKYNALKERLLDIEKRVKDYKFQYHR
jgi:hypothetical protein